MAPAPSHGGAAGRHGSAPRNTPRRTGPIPLAQVLPGVYRDLLGRVDACVERDHRPTPRHLVPIACAADLAGIPTRRVREWINAGALATENIKSVEYVDLDAVEALAAGAEVGAS